VAASVCSCAETAAPRVKEDTDKGDPEKKGADDGHEQGKRAGDVQWEPPRFLSERWPTGLVPVPA
jgi:hypothetical protein